MHQRITQCRICKGTRLERYVDLGMMPLVNRLPESPDTADEPRFPLEVLYCRDCSLSQLSVVVDPNVLFSHYVYRSSISKTFANHCAKLAQAAHERLGMREGDLVIDIASNDGCALKEFLPYGVKPLGVDPAENLAAIANAEGIPTIAKFWSPELADDIVQKRGKAKIVTAMNVFAHVHDIHSFVEGVKRVLADDGTFIIEVPYLVDLWNNNIFDTIYHEHLSYFLVSPLVTFFASHGLHLNHVERIDIHGGTIRLSVQHTNAPSPAIEHLTRLEKNEGYLSYEKYRDFMVRAERIKSELVTLIKRLQGEGKRIAGFGASAKGSIMLNYCGLNGEHISYIVDDTPEKQGKYVAGCRIPIVPRNMLETQKPDHLLVLAWNFFNEVQAKTTAFRAQGGKYILPVPSPQIL